LLKLWSLNDFVSPFNLNSSDDNSEVEDILKRLFLKQSEPECQVKISVFENTCP